MSGDHVALRHRTPHFLDPNQVGISSIEKDATAADKRVARVLEMATSAEKASKLRRVDVVEYFETLRDQNNDALVRRQEATGFLDRTKLALTECLNPSFWFYLLVMGFSVALLCFCVDFGSYHLGNYRRKWTRIAEEVHPMAGFLTFTSLCILLSCLSHACVLYISQAAKGGGIPEVKAMLGGVIFHQFLNFRALIGRWIGITLALSSGLSVGREGPYVHLAACVSYLLSKTWLFRGTVNSSTKKKQMLQAAAAAGVTATFQGPVGGPLFTLEITSSFFTVNSIWKTFFCSVSTILFYIVFHEIGKVDLWKNTVFEEFQIGWELVPIIFFGVITGVASGLFVNVVARWMRLWRNKTSRLKWIWSKYVLFQFILMQSSGYVLVSLVAIVSSFITFFIYRVWIPADT
jgi:H+/Cl- antiporter ClcA